MKNISGEKIAESFRFIIGTSSWSIGLGLVQYEVKFKALNSLVHLLETTCTNLPHSMSIYEAPTAGSYELQCGNHESSIIEDALKIPTATTYKYIMGIPGGAKTRCPRSLIKHNSNTETANRMK